MIPLIIGAVIITSSVATGGYNGVRAYNKKKKADEIFKNLEKEVNSKNSELKNAQQILIITLKELDRLYLEVYDKDFVKFEKVLKRLGKKLSIQNGKNFQNIINQINKETLDISEKRVSISIVKDTIATMASAGISGVLSYTGTVALASAVGTASTGTAISSLSGVAYTNALLAYLGGGSITAGGFGIAGGIAILGGITAAPVIVITSIGANITAEKYLTEVKKKEKEIKKKLSKVDIEINKLTNQRKKSQQYKKYFLEIRKRFLSSLDKLEKMNLEVATKEEIGKKLSTSISFARTLRELIDNPLDKNLERINL